MDRSVRQSVDPVRRSMDRGSVFSGVVGAPSVVGAPFSTSGASFST